MSSSTNDHPKDIVTFSIKIDGKISFDEDNIVSINVRSKMNKESSASIELAYFQSFDSAIPPSASASFKPGAHITIEAGYESTNQLIFQGVIRGQSIGINAASGTRFTVECQGDPTQPSSDKSPVLNLRCGENIFEMTANFTPNQLNNTCHGEVTFQGSSLVIPGNYVTISDVGENFDGDHIVSQVAHTISGEGWITQATLGLPMPSKQ